MKITEALLKTIYGVCDLLDCFTITRSDLWDTINGRDNKRWTKHKFTETLHNLNKSGYLKFYRGSDSIEFTAKARLKLIDHAASKIKKDSGFRFVSFDIPEDMRRQRDLFRRTIKRLGFVQIQKSLWAVNKNVGELVDIASHEYGVENYIVYIASNKSDIDTALNQKLVNKSP
jgi:DNA-binding transcriptional regulator PaaX